MACKGSFTASVFPLAFLGGAHSWPESKNHTHQKKKKSHVIRFHAEVTKRFFWKDKKKTHQRELRQASEV